MYASYEVSISYDSNRQTNRQINRQDKNNIPPIIWSGGIKIRWTLDLCMSEGIGRCVDHSHWEVYYMYYHQNKYIKRLTHESTDPGFVHYSSWKLANNPSGVENALTAMYTSSSTRCAIPNFMLTPTYLYMYGPPTGSWGTSALDAFIPRERPGSSRIGEAVHETAAFPHPSAIKNEVSNTNYIIKWSGISP